MDWYLLYLISGWIVCLVMIPIVVRRRKPTAAMAWLLVIFFQPWLGLLIFLLVGGNRLPLRRIRAHRNRTQQMEKLVRLAAQDPKVVQPELDPRQQSLVHLAERLGEKRVVGGNRGELLADTTDFIERLVEDIEAADNHVHLLYYIFADDDNGHRIAAALARAAQRGVVCRVLADDVGSWGMFKRLGAQMRAQGIQLQAMLPVNFFRRRLARMDLRNHRKLAVIDGRIGFSGSHNIVNAHYGTKRLVWHDLTARLTGPIVSQLQSVFVEDWFAETDDALTDEAQYFPEPEITGDILVQSLPSGPTYESENYQRLVVAALYDATRHVMITSPYLVPDAAFLQALEVAVLRGVKVELIVPEKSDQRLTDAAGRAYYEELLGSGVHIYRHTEGLLHAKTMSIDDSLALVGSGNFDMRSFYLNFELNLIAYGPQVTAALRHVQRHYLAQSFPLTSENWQTRGSFSRLLDDAAKLLSPLL